MHGVTHGVILMYHYHYYIMLQYVILLCDFLSYCIMFYHILYMILFHILFRVSDSVTML